MRTTPAHLRAFRADVYACFTQRRDALVDLVDALLTAVILCAGCWQRQLC